MATITNNLGLPEAIVQAIRNDPYDSEGSDLTASGVGQPPRIWALRKRHGHEIVEDAADRIYSLLGQSVHAILERSEPSALTETRLYTEIDGWTVSGQYDRLTLTPFNILQDYKVTTVYQANGIRRDFEEQLNTLAYLARVNGHRIDKLEVVMIFRDWSLQKAKRDESHPQKPVIVKEIPLWTESAQLEFLKDRVAAMKAALESLPECSDEDRWLRGEKWAVMKKGNKRAVRLHDDSESADKHADTDDKLYVEHRPGTYVRCEDYCSVAPFCSQWQQQRDVA